MSKEFYCIPLEKMDDIVETLKQTALLVNCKVACDNAKGEFYYQDSLAEIPRIATDNINYLLSLKPVSLNPEDMNHEQSQEE